MGYPINRQEKKYDGRNGFDSHYKKLTAVDGYTIDPVNSYRYYLVFRRLKIESVNTCVLLLFVNDKYQMTSGEKMRVLTFY